MLNRKERHQKRAQRRAGKERWYHGAFDLIADIFLFVPEVLGLLLRGVFYLLRGILELLGAIIT